MSCNPLTDPACIITKVIPPITGTVTGGILAGIAQAMNEGIRWIVVNTATWWIQIPSPDLAAEPAVARIQAWLLPITLAIGVGGVIAAGLRMAVTRRAAPLLDVSSGLLALAAAITLGVIIPALLLRAGDAWSSWVLQASTGGHFTQRLTGMLQLGGNAAPAVVLILGLVAIVLALAQAVLMLFRQVALVILAGVLPLAAAGTVAPLTRPWIRKISSWTLALICYKPAAAAVYAAAFTMFGSGRGTRTVLMGFVTMLLSLVALPALMKFFTWTTGSIAESGGGGQLLGTAALGAVAVGALRSGSAGGSASAARDQAAYLSSRLGPPPAGGAPPDPGNPASPGGSGGPAGPPAPSGSAAAQPVSAFPPAAAPPSAYGAPAGATASAPAYGSPAPGGTPAGAAPASGGSAMAATGAAEASAGSAGAAARAASGTAAGAAAAAGPAGLPAAAAAQAAQAAADTTSRLAEGALGPEGDR